MEATSDDRHWESGSTIWRSELGRGFLTITPLWPGVAAFGIAFALVARASGFSPVETQLCSMLVFAGSAQLTVVTLFGDRAGVLAITLTVVVLNLRHVLYALSLDRLLPRRTHFPRPLLAFFLTDEAFGFTIRRAISRSVDLRVAIEPYCLGSAVSLYTVFSLATVAGLLFGSLLPDPERIALSFVFPLTFLALLLPLLTSGPAVLVGGTAGATALGLSMFMSGGATVVGVTFVAAGLGAALDLRLPVKS